MPNDPNDPDAQDLPPHIQLPDGDVYKVQQLFARMIIHLILLGVMIFWTLVIATDKRISVICTCLAAVVVLVGVARWLLARSACAKARQRR